MCVRVLQHVHVMKVETPDDAVCYVTQLNRSLATPPHVYAARNTDVRNTGRAASEIIPQNVHIKQVIIRR